MKPQWVIAALAAALWLAPASPGRAQDEVLNVDSWTLMRLYDQNELAAKRQYEGRRVRLTMQPLSVSADKDGRPYVYLISYSSRISRPRPAAAYFEKTRRDDLLKVIENLVNEKPVTVVCTVRGLELFAVALDGCSLD